jgi:hypothetical protein
VFRNTFSWRSSAYTRWAVVRSFRITRNFLTIWAKFWSFDTQSIRTHDWRNNRTKSSTWAICCSVFSFLFYTRDILTSPFIISTIWKYLTKSWITSTWAISTSIRCEFRTEDKWFTSCFSFSCSAQWFTATIWTSMWFINRASIWR